jgi:nitrite reductase/ring-hydroxylating ferredoxin subunit
MTPPGFVKVAKTGELSPGDKKLVNIGDQRILLVNVDGSYYAVDEVCPHALAFLSMGQLYNDEVVCPLHGSAFDIKTGAVLSPPAMDSLAVYPVKVEGEHILVGAPQIQDNGQQSGDNS